MRNVFCSQAGVGKTSIASALGFTKKNRVSRFCFSSHWLSDLFLQPDSFTGRVEALGLAQLIAEGKVPLNLQVRKNSWMANFGKNDGKSGSFSTRGKDLWLFFFC